MNSTSTSQRFPSHTTTRDRVRASLIHLPAAQAIKKDKGHQGLSSKSAISSAEMNFR